MSSTDEVLIVRARVAAGCAWDGKSGGHGNETPPQEPEVRRILRECADRLVTVNPNAGFVDTRCESCGRRMIAQLDDNCPATFCPPCGGGCVCAAYGAIPPQRRGGEFVEDEAEPLSSDCSQGGGA